jgi:hypothetical protein
MSHYGFSKLLEQLALQWFAEILSVHFGSRAILNDEVSLLNLIRQKEIANVECPSLFA